MHLASLSYIVSVSTHKYVDTYVSSVRSPALSFLIFSLCLHVYFCSNVFLSRTLSAALYPSLSLSFILCFSLSLPFVRTSFFTLCDVQLPILSAVRQRTTSLFVHNSSPPYRVPPRFFLHQVQFEDMKLGTGAMVAAAKDGTLDVIIALTGTFHCSSVP